MSRKIVIVIVMFITFTAAKHLLVKTEGIVQHSTVMALTTPWQDSAAAASDEESFGGKVAFGGEVEGVENGNDYRAKVMKKKLTKAVSKG